MNRIKKVFDRIYLKFWILLCPSSLKCGYCRQLCFSYHKDWKQNLKVCPTCYNKGMGLKRAREMVGEIIAG